VNDISLSSAMVSALECLSSRPGFSPDYRVTVHCVLSQYRRINCWVGGGGIILGGSRDTPSRFILRKPG